jgi:hypothetical protein
MEKRIAVRAVGLRHYMVEGRMKFVRYASGTTMDKTIQKLTKFGAARIMT